MTNRETEALAPSRDADLTRALADELADLRYAALAPGDVEQIKRLVLDHLGVALRGAGLPWSLALAEWATGFDGSGPCVVIGTPIRVAPSVAALVNATAAHGLELDDTHDEAVSHPGAVVTAAALCVATAAGASGRALLAAIAAGYEAVGRIGVAAGAGGVIDAGFHPTALFGGFGAAAAAGKLIGLDAERLTRAFGLMLSMAGGAMQFSQDAAGTTVKRLHAGYAAQAGVLAAEFAARGIAGPARALDGTYGLLALYGGGGEPGCLRRAPGAPLEIHRISLKPYPCCRLFHSTIDALGLAAEGLSLAPASISRITVGGPALILSQHMLRRPTSPMAAQYSLPFVLGAAVVAGPHDDEAYAEERLSDPRVLAVADRVEAVADAKMEAAFPAHFGSWVEITLEDGTRRRAEVLDSYGTPANPMPTEAIKAKFAGLAAKARPKVPAEEAMRAVWSLDAETSPATLAELFSDA